MPLHNWRQQRIFRRLFWQEKFDWKFSQERIYLSQNIFWFCLICLFGHKFGVWELLSGRSFLQWRKLGLGIFLSNFKFENQVLRHVSFQVRQTRKTSGFCNRIFWDCFYRSFPETKTLWRQKWSKHLQKHHQFWSKRLSSYCLCISSGFFYQQSVHLNCQYIRREGHQSYLK